MWSTPIWGCILYITYPFIHRCSLVSFSMYQIVYILHSTFILLLTFIFHLTANRKNIKWLTYNALYQCYKSFICQNSTFVKSAQFTKKIKCNLLLHKQMGAWSSIGTYVTSRQGFNSHGFQIMKIGPVVPQQCPRPGPVFFVLAPSLLIWACSWAKRSSLWASSARLFSIYHSLSLLMISKLIQIQNCFICTIHKLTYSRIRSLKPMMGLFDSTHI